MAVFDETGPGAPPPGTPIPEITQADRDFTAKYAPIQLRLALPGVPGMPQSLNELVPGGAVPNVIARARGTGNFGLPAASVPANPSRTTTGPLSPVATPPASATPEAATSSTPPTAADVDEARRRAAAYFALGSAAQGPIPLSSAFAAAEPTPQPQPQQSRMPRPLNAPIYGRLG